MLVKKKNDLSERFFSCTGDNNNYTTIYPNDVLSNAEFNIGNTMIILNKLFKKRDHFGAV